MNTSNMIMHEGKLCVVPTQINLDVVGGLCNANCIMCGINMTKRPPGIMKEDTFRIIVDKMEIIKEHLEYISLHFSGEPLLDKGIVDKVGYLKKKGFKGVGFASNCNLLMEIKAEELVMAGLDTIICSVDGFTRETHEKIRVGTHFDTVVKNIQQCIAVRNRLNGKLKIMVRFIRQELNHHEWEVYKNYWLQWLDPEKGDKLLRFDVHNMSGVLHETKKVPLQEEVRPTSNIIICHEINSRMIIMSDGTICMCCGDNATTLEALSHLGNIRDRDIINLFNSPQFRLYRGKIDQGLTHELELCKACTIPISQEYKKVI